MNGRHKGIQNYLLRAFFLFLLLFSPADAYYDLADSEIPSQVPIVEKGSLVDMELGGKVHCRGFASNASALMLLLAPAFFDQVSSSPSPINSSHQQASVLRC